MSSIAEPGPLEHLAGGRDRAGQHEHRVVADARRTRGTGPAGVRPSAAAFSSLMISAAEAPSVSGEELPGGDVPGDLGEPLAAICSVVERRASARPACRRWCSAGSSRPPVQACRRAGSTGTISRSKRRRRRPRRPAGASGPRTRRAPARLSFHRAAISSARDALRDRPGSGTVRRARRRTGPGPAGREPIGTRLIDSTPQAMTMSYAPAMTPWAAKWAACWLEPHWRSMVVPGT